MDQNNRTFIDEMIKIIIRPTRDCYSLEKLGPTQMIVKTKLGIEHSTTQKYNKYIQITRKDIKIECKGKRLNISIYYPDSQPTNCLIYLHANSGSRLEGAQLVKFILCYGYMMVIFDYRGSGVSEGQWTSMGIHESEDLEKVIDHIAKNEKISSFSLWGRSMGAVTILYYLMKQYSINHAQQHICVDAIVLDCPFSSMQKLMYEIGSNKISLPDFIFAPIISSINERISQLFGINFIKELNLIEKIEEIKYKKPRVYQLISNIKALFLTSKEDKLIHHTHAQTLHQHFPFCTKELQYLNLQHNDPRSEQTKQKCAEFACKFQHSQLSQSTANSPRLFNQQNQLKFVFEPIPPITFQKSEQFTDRFNDKKTIKENAQISHRESNALNAFHTNNLKSCQSHTIQIPKIIFSPISESNQNFTSKEQKLKDIKRETFGPTINQKEGKNKLSLTQIRRMQKLQQQKCSLKTSKIIATLEKPIMQDRQYFKTQISPTFSPPFGSNNSKSYFESNFTTKKIHERIQQCKNGEKQVFMLGDKSRKAKKQDGQERKNDMVKSMKTSLIGNRHLAQRKNSYHQEQQLRSSQFLRRQKLKNYTEGNEQFLKVPQL